MGICPVDPAWARCLASVSGAVARLDLNLAYLFASQGNTQQALQRYNAARQIYIEQANAPAVATVDLHRSDLYLTLNLRRETLDQVDSALPVFSEAAMPFEQGRLLLNRALTQQANDDSLSQDFISIFIGYRII